MTTKKTDPRTTEEVADTSKTVSFPAASKPGSVNLSTLEIGSESVKQSVSLQDGGTNQTEEGTETMPVMTAVPTAKPHPTVRRRVVTKTSKTVKEQGDNSNNGASVETAKIDVSTPLVGTVTAGSIAETAPQNDVKSTSHYENPSVVTVTDIEDLSKNLNQRLADWDGVQLIRSKEDSDGNPLRFIIAVLAERKEEEILFMSPGKASVDGVVGFIVLVPEPVPSDQFDALAARCDKILTQFYTKQNQTRTEKINAWFRGELKERYPYVRDSKGASPANLIATAKGLFGTGWIDDAVYKDPRVNVEKLGFDLNAWDAVEAFNVAGAYIAVGEEQRLWLDDAINDLMNSVEDPKLGETIRAKRERYTWLEMVASAWDDLKDKDNPEFPVTAEEMGEHLDIPASIAAKYMQAYTILSSISDEEAVYPSRSIIDQEKETIKETEAPPVGSDGTGAETSTEVTQSPTILEIIRQSVADGATFDRSATGLYKPESIIDDLETYVKKGSLRNIFGPEENADVIAENPGCTPASIATEYFQWREARRLFCNDLRRFIAAVEEDETRRDAEEADLLPKLTMEERGVRGKAKAAEILQDMESLMQRMTAGSESMSDAADAISDHFLECENQITLQPCVQNMLNVNVMGSAIFGPDLIPSADDDGGATQWAFAIGAILLETNKYFDNSDCLLEVAAIVTHKRNEKRKQAALIAN